MVHRAALAVFVILVATHAAAQSPAPQLLELSKQYQAAVKARDAAKVGALYAEDAVLMPPDTPVVKGRNAIQQDQARSFKESPEAELTITPVSSETSGDLGYIQGEFVFKDRNVHMKGKYVEVWKRVNGQWKILYDIYNSNERPVPPKPPTPPMPPTPPQ
jgi:ketosteroid isomerase-like protein